MAANYQGLQTGWFGKILKDEFNLVLNIIAPQVSGDGEALYQTRTAAGNLGDIILLDNADMVECVDVGLVADISGDIQNYPNLMKYWEQIEMFNEGIGDGVWAIPTEMNTNGPTAVVKSCAKMDHLKTGGTLLNQKFTPSVVAGEQGLQQMANLVRAYFAMDGHHIQFNVIDRQTLLDAQAHPEEYKDLIVRVAGYSDHFRNLSRALQDEIIARTEQSFS